ncbi:PHA/PHB synthase family protein [Methylibium petroleiphilum]|uniref:PHA/PHB synthase family protein n=1 Tax=Methylibium petroleiphilum TaxID=105560 RepID=UPI003B5C5C52
MDFAQSAQQLAQGWTEALKGMTGVQLPADALPALQSTYLSEAAALWNQATQGADGAPPPTDRRFAAKDWMSNPAAAFTAGMYMLNARTLLQLADQVQADEKTRQRIRFAVQQWIDASSPANYLALNPEAQRKAIETQGESITQGLQHLWHDVRQGHLSQTDESLFEVGRNVATTEGSVVFENALFQLIEYKPLTAKVHERPLLIVPPCINKFYIMDLQPENSLVRYAVSQGHRVFMLSWVNADESLGDKTWDDYIEHAVIRAIREVQAISKQEQINTLGFCIGGTLLATALAVLAARGEQPSASLTMLTSFLDFSDTGVLDLFVDEQMVSMREMALGQGGLLKGKELAATFSFLRPNDLVWNYVVGNYLKGETPPPFDLLYWNSDSTNLPGPMYCWYLRHTYLENNLIKPGKVTVCGEPLDLRKVNLPTFIYASREDHIVPWQSAYATVEVLPGKKQFVLGASGHIAGVINPPAKNKRSHWINSRLPKTADAWFEGATEHPGSWWPAWTDWLKPLGGKLVPAPKAPGDRNHKIIEPAPGRYVKAKA